MPLSWYEYAIALNWDNAAGQLSFDTYFKRLRRGTRVPLGAVTRTTLDRHRQTNGARLAMLQTTGCMFQELEAYVGAIFGGFEPTEESVNVTLRWRGLDNAFHNYNALAHYPRDGEHYEHVTLDRIRNLRLEFDILEDLPDPD